MNYIHSNFDNLDTSKFSKILPVWQFVVKKIIGSHTYSKDFISPDNSLWI